MPRRLHVFLVVCLVAFCASFVVQTVYQEPLGGRMSVWGGNGGWQREIAFWNVGMALVVAQALRAGDAAGALAVARGATVLFLLLGLNHAAALLQDPGAAFHWPPFIFNTVGFVFGLRAGAATLHTPR